MLSITDHGQGHRDINQNTANIVKSRNPNQNVPGLVLIAIVLTAIVLTAIVLAPEAIVRAHEATEMSAHLITEVKNIIHRRHPNRKRREDVHRAAEYNNNIISL